MILGPYSWNPGPLWNIEGKRPCLCQGFASDLSGSWSVTTLQIPWCGRQEWRPLCHHDVLLRGLTPANDTHSKPASNPGQGSACLLGDTMQCIADHCIANSRRLRGKEMNNRRKWRLEKRCGQMQWYHGITLSSSQDSVLKSIMCLCYGKVIFVLGDWYIHKTHQGFQSLYPSLFSTFLSVSIVISESLFQLLVISPLFYLFIYILGWSEDKAGDGKLWVWIIWLNMTIFSSIIISNDLSLFFFMIE